MYYLMMKTAIKPDLKTKTFCHRSRKSYINLREKEINLIDIKFYQKLIELISFAIRLGLLSLIHKVFVFKSGLIAVFIIN